MEVVGSVIAGSHGKIIIRQKSGSTIELGDLLRVDHEDGGYSILQVNDLAFASQIPVKQLEMISGMKLEGYSSNLEFMEPSLRNYLIASVKAVLTVKDEKQKIPKILPPFFGAVKMITDNDLGFLTKPDNSVFVGNVRSGSKILDVEVNLDGIDVFTHHVLIPATTGRGKSNLLKVLLWEVINKDYCGILVLDPHDEYYGRHKKVLKDHPAAKENVIYYSPRPVPGSITLIFDYESIKPWHFRGVVEFTPAQRQAMSVAFNNYGDKWLSSIIQGEELPFVKQGTVAVLKRKIDTILGLYLAKDGTVQSRSRVFDKTLGSRTVKDILNQLESGKKVIIDTSSFTDELELLIGSIIINEAFNNYRRYKLIGDFDQKPVISIVVEEAPRVLSHEVLKSGKNIFSIIAREGRKFKVGLIAITQLTSIIPKTILANMNTKIILGNELSSERDAIIQSASQDLSSDDQNIASLDKGEAIVSSNFTKFAIPIKIPLFEDYIKKYNPTRQKEKNTFVG